MGKWLRITATLTSQIVVNLTKYVIFFYVFTFISKCLYHEVAIVRLHENYIKTSSTLRGIVALQKQQCSQDDAVHLVTGVCTAFMSALHFAVLQNAFK